MNIQTVAIFTVHTDHKRWWSWKKCVMQRDFLHHA